MLTWLRYHWLLWRWNRALRKRSLLIRTLGLQNALLAERFKGKNIFQRRKIFRRLRRAAA